MTMTREEIARARRLLGPAPILSSEEPEQFEDFFVRLASDLKPQDFIEVLLIWHFTLASWNLNRYILHAAVAIERHHEEGVRQELLRTRLQHEQTKKNIKRRSEALDQLTLRLSPSLRRLETPS